MTARTAGCDVEIAGHNIAAGDMVALLLGGANRDPHAFPDPNSFDISRLNARDHLAFASGVHHASAPLWPASRARPHCAHSSKPFPICAWSNPCNDVVWSICADSPGCQRNWAADGQHPPMRDDGVRS